jgi:hypothetical protein
MRTVISHFYNEAYLLPWWLSHHRNLFDYGILINHGSTDNSLEIIKEYVPNWRIVNSTLTFFDAFMTDLEVMSYEKEIPGWKIALNVTEFLISTVDLNSLQSHLESEKRTGVACSGYILVDNRINNQSLDKSMPLLKQLNWGFNDNADISPENRLAMNLGSILPSRNRFFHKNPVGMYQPGRHQSYHPESNVRLSDLMILHCGFAPWNTDFIHRKTGIKDRINPDDFKRGWGLQHLKERKELDRSHKLALDISYDLRSDDFVNRALINIT